MCQSCISSAFPLEERTLGLIIEDRIRSEMESHVYSCDLVDRLKKVFIFLVCVLAIAIAVSIAKMLSFRWFLVLGIVIQIILLQTYFQFLAKIFNFITRVARYILNLWTSHQTKTHPASISSESWTDYSWMLLVSVTTMRCTLERKCQHKQTQGSINQRHREHFKALIRVHVIPRFTNQSIDPPLYIILYVVLYCIQSFFQNIKGCTIYFCRYYEYVIRIVHGNRAIESRSFPRSTWVHTRVTCTRRLNIYYSTRATIQLYQTRIIETTYSLSILPLSIQ